LNAILTNNIKDLAPGQGLFRISESAGTIQAEIETYATAESLFCVSYSLIRNGWSRRWTNSSSWMTSRSAMKRHVRHAWRSKDRMPQTSLEN